MEKRNKRIASFIESLGCEEMSIESQSFLLTADLDSIGAGVNGGNCLNSGGDNCSMNKQDCRNIGDCRSSENLGDCKNGEIIKPNPGDNPPANTGCQ